MISESWNAIAVFESPERTWLVRRRGDDELELPGQILVHLRAADLACSRLDGNAPPRVADAAARVVTAAWQYIGVAIDSDGHERSKRLASALAAVGLSGRVPDPIEIDQRNRAELIAAIEDLANA